MATERATCGWCGGDAIVGTTCPKSLDCAVCGVGPGERCRRPSGHVADQLHSSRIVAAELLDKSPRSGDASGPVSPGY